VDDTARGWFHRLRLPNCDWALTPAFSGIHSAALRQEDLALIAQHGGSVVWSPLSNYLLYGATLDLWAARRAGVVLGLGSDWALAAARTCWAS
jgi:cytosine/adenosine deaminase-related metal-dependent hydrolase